MLDEAARFRGGRRLAGTPMGGGGTEGVGWAAAVAVAAVGGGSTALDSDLARMRPDMRRASVATAPMIKGRSRRRARHICKPPRANC